MRELHLLPVVVVACDVSGPPDAVLCKLWRILAEKVFKVVRPTLVHAAIDGMDYLADTLGQAAGFQDLAGAQAAAKKLGITLEGREDDISRMQRVAACDKKAPLVASTVPPEWRPKYY